MSVEVYTEDESTPGIEDYDSFDVMGIRPALLRGIYAYGFEHPSTIQQRAIVPMSQGKDILAQSQSGTGKTATFLIGSLMQITSDFVENPQILIITPTRELALQIQNVSKALSNYTDTKCSVVIGGCNIREDINKLRNEVNHIIVGTPGRILHLLEKNYLLSSVHVQCYII